MKNNYLLLTHIFFEGRLNFLKDQIRKLKQTLPESEYLTHEIVKFVARLRAATLEIIPLDPNRIEYQLSGELRKYRRYKQGLQRYRLFFTFSSHPKIIIYLYINDEKHLRKDGDKNDPYEEFSKLCKKGVFTSNPLDPNIQKWLQNLKF